MKRWGQRRNNTRSKTWQRRHHRIYSREGYSLWVYIEGWIHFHSFFSFTDFSSCASHYDWSHPWFYPWSSLRRRKERDCSSSSFRFHVSFSLSSSSSYLSCLFHLLLSLDFIGYFFSLLLDSLPENPVMVKTRDDKSNDDSVIIAITVLALLFHIFIREFIVSFVDTTLFSMSKEDEPWVEKRCKEKVIRTNEGTKVKEKRYQSRREKSRRDTFSEKSRKKKMRDFLCTVDDDDGVEP